MGKRPTIKPTTARPTEKPTHRPTTSDPTKRPTDKPTPEPKTHVPTTSKPTTAIPTLKPPAKKKQRSGGKGSKGSNGGGDNGASMGKCIGQSGAHRKVQKKCSKKKDYESCSADDACEWITSANVFANADGGLRVDTMNHSDNKYLYIGVALLCASLLTFIYCQRASHGKKEMDIFNETKPL